MIRDFARSAIVLAAMLFGLAGCAIEPASINAPEPTAATNQILPSPGTAGETVQTVRGESMMLRGTDSVALLWSPESIVAVYGYDARGQRVDYRRGVDWTVGDQGISRTPRSRIPDFATYSYAAISPCDVAVFSRACVNWSMNCVRSEPACRRDHKGTPTFAFRVEPRNPDVTINYGVYVDYRARVPARTITPIAPKADVKSIACLGDSIARGAHTVANHYRNSDEESWCGLLRKSFGPEVSVTNISDAGALIDGLTQSYRRTANTTPPDMLIVAAGMNDHVLGAGNLGAFTRKLDAIVRSARANGTKVVLVGFFQQNPLWSEENPADTIAYNRAIKELAERHKIGFVDIYSAYNAISRGGDPYYHLTGDYMHHPNAYGQRIYYSLILPHVVTSQASASSFPDYVTGPW
jgi:lysophospholipase L1-like esterase